MPKVLSYTPSWLSRPSAGFDLFNNEKQSTSNGVAQYQNSDGPRNTLVSRGTEIFVLVGNAIRWADLAMLKDDWETRTGPRDLEHDSSFTDEERIFEEVKFKTLKVPIHEQIQELVPSPNGELLAVLTAHTVNVAVLPDHSHLDQPDTSPIRLKTYTLGPTIHVLSQARIASALWHPLGVNGNCLVTVTADAVVRLWELKKENRWSFDSPSIDIDLRKLSQARSTEDDVSADRIGDNRGFSVDSIGMEVACAAFGGTGSDEEAGWSAMTLWIAMTEGDVYALCPLLPAEWQPSATLVPSLTATVAAKRTFLDHPDATSEQEEQFDAQFQWLAELDQQEPRMIASKPPVYPTMLEVPVFKRPECLPQYPKLQGPFRILPGDIEDDLELAGIHIIAPRVYMDELFDGEHDPESVDVVDATGVSCTLVCLLNASGRVYICLNLQEIEGQWLRSKQNRSQKESDPIFLPELVLLDALETMSSPTSLGRREFRGGRFSPDPYSRYNFYITHSTAVFFFSLLPWLGPLENELCNNTTTGLSFRMSVLTSKEQTLRECILKIEKADKKGNLLRSAAIVFRDSDLGYFLLTASTDRPYGIDFDKPLQAPSKEPQSDLEGGPDVALLTAAPRQAYESPRVLYEQARFYKFSEANINKRYQKTLKDEIRLSSATLEVMTEAHRILSQDTHNLGVAVAEVFGRCRRLRPELDDQISRVEDIASKILKINDEDSDDIRDQEGMKGAARLNQRFEMIKEKQELLVQRYDALRKKLARARVRPLSAKEKSWAAEVQKLQATLTEPEDFDKGKRTGGNHWQRYLEVQNLMKDLIPQAEEAMAQGSAASNASDKKSPNGNSDVPSDVRRNKVSRIMTLLDRETALVTAAQERLEQLKISIA